MGVKFVSEFNVNFLLPSDLSGNLHAPALYHPLLQSKTRELGPETFGLEHVRVSSHTHRLSKTEELR